MKVQSRDPSVVGTRRTDGKYNFPGPSASSPGDGDRFWCRESGWPARVFEHMGCDVGRIEVIATSDVVVAKTQWTSAEISVPL